MSGIRPPPPPRGERPSLPERTTTAAPAVPPRRGTTRVLRRGSPARTRRGVTASRGVQRGRGRVKRGTLSTRGSSAVSPQKAHPPCAPSFDKHPTNPTSDVGSIRSLPVLPEQQNKEFSPENEGIAVQPDSTVEVTPKKKNRRQEILSEILSTERAYVSSLLFLVEAYIDPLSEESKNPILSPTDILKLFSSVKLIVNVNQELLNSLEERFGETVSESQCVGDVFLKLAPYLKLYNQYSANYDDAIKTLDSLKVEKERFVSFLNDVADNGGGQHAEISFYLIMPIQRIPRKYKDLLKETDSEHPDQVLVSNAVQKIKEVASNVNNSIKAAEHINKIAQIQTELIGYDELLLIPTRRLIRESSVFKISTKGDLLPRSLFLFNDLLLLTKRKATQLILKEDVPIHLTWAKSLPNTDKYENVFQVASNKRTLVLSMNSESERDDWVREISENRSQQVSSSEKLSSERHEVESCLQPRLHAKFFQIDEYSAPMTSHNSEHATKAQKSVQTKRTRNATTMIERLSSAAELGSDVTSALFPLDELEDDSLQKFSGSETENATPTSQRETQNSSNSRRERIRLPNLHKSIRIVGSDITEPDFYGYLTKQGGIRLSWKRRWFVLKAKFLCYYRTRQDDNPAGIISLRNYCIAEAGKHCSKPYALRMVCPDARTYYMYADTDEKIKQWIEVLQSTTHTNQDLDSSCITPLIFYMFWDGENPTHIHDDAAYLLKLYFDDPLSDSGLVEYLQKPTSFKPLKKLVSAPSGIATDVLLSLVRKLMFLALVEEVGKSLIAHGFIECLYSHLENESCGLGSTELQRCIGELLASLSRFDFFPCSKSLSVLIPWMHPGGESKFLFHIATVFRNAAPFGEFRQMVIEENAIVPLYSCLECNDEGTIEKFLQGLLLLICDQSQCGYSANLFARAAQMSLNPLTHLLKLSSAKVHWILLKLMNTLSAVDPSLLQTLDVNCAPRMIEIFVNDPDPAHSALVFELTRFFNMMSRNHWIRGTLDNNELFIERLIKIISETDELSLKDVGLRCLGNMCTSDKNKIVVYTVGVDVLLAQLLLDEPRVQEKVLHCISYAVMNDKNKVAFVTDVFVDQLASFLQSRSKPVRYQALSVMESANSPLSHQLADKLADRNHMDIVLTSLLSMNDMHREQGIRAASCLAISDKAKKGLVKAGCIDIFTRLLSDKHEIAVNAVGALNNIFMLSELKSHMSAEILQGIFQVLSKAKNSFDKKVSIHALACVAFQDLHWAQQIHKNPKFEKLSEMENLPAFDKSLSAPLSQLFSVVLSQVNCESGADISAATYNSVQVKLVYYRPRFWGYKIM